MEKACSLLPNIVFLVYRVSYPSGGVAGGKGGSWSSRRGVARSVLTVSVGEMGGGVPLAQFTPVIRLAIAIESIGGTSVSPTGFGRIVGRSLVAFVLAVVSVAVVAVAISAIVAAVVSVAAIVATVAVVSVVIVIVSVVSIRGLKDFWVAAVEIRTFTPKVSELSTMVAGYCASAVAFVFSLSLVNEG